MSKRTIIILIIIFVLLLLAVGVYFIVKSKPKTESDKAIADEAANTPGGGTYNPAPIVPADFPLKKGMNGSLVSDVQRYLSSTAACKTSFKLTGASIPAVDGAFGPITEKALKSCKGTATVTKELYDAMMQELASPAASTSTSASTSFAKNNWVYLANSQSMLYSYPENNANYFVGRVSKTNFLDKPIGMYDSAATGGFVKINVTGYEPYDKASGGYGPMKMETKTVYIYKTALRKTPF